jgi:mono/diheme cytochrome c family protein
MRNTCFALLLAAAACSSSGPRLPRAAKGAQVIEIRGALEEGPFVLGEADLAAMPRRAVRGLDPVTGREARWEGTPLALLISDRVAPKQGTDTVIVRTAEGTAVPIPLTVIRQRQPVLADRADGAPMATRVIAWPNLEQAGLPTDPRQGSWWARGVRTLEIVYWQGTLGNALAAPAGAPDRARLGSGEYGSRCVACHRLRGAGGERGPDLTRVAERLPHDRFIALLERHPLRAEGGSEPPGSDASEDLWVFLRAVAATTDGQQDATSAPAAAAAGMPDHP